MRLSSRPRILRPIPPQPAPQPRREQLRAAAPPADSGAKRPPTLEAQAFSARTSPSSIPAAILSPGTGKAGTSATTRFFRPVSKSISTPRRPRRRLETEYQALLHANHGQAVAGEDHVHDPPMKLSSFWRKLRSIRMMPTSAIPSPTRFTPLGSPERTVTGSTQPAKRSKTKGNASNGTLG